MKQYKIKRRGIVMQNPYSPHGYFAWPTVVRLQNGRLAVGASGYRVEHIDPFGKGVIAFSEDEGLTWSIPAPVIDTPLDDRDGGLLAYGKSSLLFSSFNNTLVMQHCFANMAEKRLEALEGEERAKEMANISYRRAYIDRMEHEKYEEKYLGSTYRVSHDCGITWGPIHRAPVSAPHGPVLMQDGTILFVGTATDGRRGIYCYTIDGEGGSAFLSKIPSIPSDEHGDVNEYEPHAIVLPSGKIIVHIRGEHRIFGIWQSTSIDGGVTFSVPQMIGGSPLVGAPAHLLRHSSGTLVSVVGVRHAPFGVNVLTSKDDGESWEVGTLITDAACDDVGYPASCELADGSIYTVWYQRATVAENSGATVHGVSWEL